MILAITGTPGTGKTSVAEELSEEFRVIEIKDFCREKGIGEEIDGELEIPVDEMIEALEKDIVEEEDVLIEGHLSHYFPADFCIVLRCQPEELEERLEQRDYPEEKIEENLEAEALDIVLSETVENQENIIEIDTSNREAGEVAEEIKEKIEKGETVYGNIDWSNYF